VDRATEVERAANDDGAGFWDYLPTIRMRRTRERDRGRPTSSNRASSFHLRWGGLPTGIVEAEAVLEVVEPPRVAELYFWALQVTFSQGARSFGGAHLGLQWHPQHPGSTAVNWGGYAAAGGELDGSTSDLPSALHNPNTRDMAWEPHRPYRLRVARSADRHGWTGWVDDRPVRDLFAGGSELTGLMVWSEVFARCDDPTAAVRWSGLVGRDEAGREHRPDRLTVTYQSVTDGGCTNTDVVVAPDGRSVEQRTATPRTVPAGVTLPFGSAPVS
jgi:hypothetical protein